MFLLLTVNLVNTFSLVFVANFRRLFVSRVLLVSMNRPINLFAVKHRDKVITEGINVKKLFNTCNAKKHRT